MAAENNPSQLASCYAKLARYSNAQLATLTTSSFPFARWLGGKLRAFYSQIK